MSYIPFDDAVKKTIELSRAYQAHLDKTHDVSILERFERESVDLIALESFLNSLPEEQVYMLLTLMYAGRDEDKDAKGLFAYLKGITASKGIAIIVMTEKFPLADYLEKGIELIPDYETFLT